MQESKFYLRPKVLTASRAAVCCSGGIGGVSGVVMRVNPMVGHGVILS